MKKISMLAMFALLANVACATETKVETKAETKAGETNAIVTPESEKAADTQTVKVEHKKNDKNCACEKCEKKRAKKAAKEAAKKEEAAEKKAHEEVKPEAAK